MTFGLPATIGNGQSRRFDEGKTRAKRERVEDAVQLKLSNSR